MKGVVGILHDLVGIMSLLVGIVKKTHQKRPPNLHGGSLRLEVDGDLFKVTVKIAVIV